MKAIFKRTSLLLMGALIGISTVQAQKSPQDMDRFIDALMRKNDCGRENRTVEPTRHGRHHHRTGQEQRRSRKD